MTPPSTPLAPAALHHLVGVWNPSYADDAMDAHLRVLLHWTEARRQRQFEEEDVYVWWGKVRSSNRQAPLPHAAEVLTLDEQVRSGGETHLYLTDYRSLYVALLGEVTADDVMEDAGERGHAPAYYDGLHVDFWFRCWDIRRLVADDTVEVVDVLKGLRNVRYADRPVSLYGGMVNLPLLVKEARPTPYFADAELLTGGILWAERDAELRSEIPRLSRELRDNLLGRQIWRWLDPATRTFLSAGEAIFRSRREDPAFDFSSVAISYAKAVETEANVLIFGGLQRALARSGPREREVWVNGERVDLGGVVPRKTLGVMARLLGDDETVRRGLRVAFPHDFAWMAEELPRRLEDIAALRNPAAHGALLGREPVEAVRDEVLGIGAEGLIVRLARIGRRR
jgi:hypothetical protein